MNDDLVKVGLVVITGIVTAIGSAAVSLRVDRRKWRRETQGPAYQAVLHLANVLVNAIQSLRILMVNFDQASFHDEDEQQNALNTFDTDASAAVQAIKTEIEDLQAKTFPEVLLFSSRRAATRLGEFVTVFDDWLAYDDDEKQTRQQMLDDIALAVTRARAAQAELLNALRRDLDNRGLKHADTEAIVDALLE